MSTIEDQIQCAHIVLFARKLQNFADKHCKGSHKQAPMDEEDLTILEKDEKFVPHSIEGNFRRNKRHHIYA